MLAGNITGRIPLKRHTTIFMKAKSALRDRCSGGGQEAAGRIARGKTIHEEPAPADRGPATVRALRGIFHAECSHRWKTKKEHGPAAIERHHPDLTTRDWAGIPCGRKRCASIYGHGHVGNSPRWPMLTHRAVLPLVPPTRAGVFITGAEGSEQNLLHAMVTRQVSMHGTHRTSLPTGRAPESELTTPAPRRTPARCAAATGAPVSPARG